MREYKNHDNHFDSHELDPCIAAEVRLKKAICSGRLVRLAIALAILIVIIFAVVIAIIAYLRYRSTNSRMNDKFDPMVESFEFAYDYDNGTEVPSNTSTRVYSDSGGSGSKSGWDTSNQLSTSVSSDVTTPVDSEANETVAMTLVSSTFGVKYGKDTDEEHRSIPGSRNITKQIDSSNVTEVEDRDNQSDSVLKDIELQSSSEAFMSNSTTPEVEKLNESSVQPFTSSEIPLKNRIVTSQPPITTTSISPFTVSAMYDFETPNLNFLDDLARDCQDYVAQGKKQSGIYTLLVRKTEFNALCDMETNGGGWTVIQRRIDGEIHFDNRTWNEYVKGFGELTASFWLGLEKIRKLIIARGEQLVTLRIELKGDSCDDKSRCSNLHSGFWWGEWNFKISDADENYRLTISPAVAGNLTEQSSDKFYIMSNGRAFTTIDRDNDHMSGNCAQFRNYGGWWHNDCGYVALNGRYGDTSSKMRGLHWFYSKSKRPRVTYYIKPIYTEMKVRAQI